MLGRRGRSLRLCQRMFGEGGGDGKMLDIKELVYC